MAPTKRKPEEEPAQMDVDEVRCPSRCHVDVRRRPRPWTVRVLARRPRAEPAVDFDFFDLRPIDRQAIRNLLQQLLSHDASAVDLGGLADVMIEREEAIGSTVKCDGAESDPYAFCSLVNPAAQRDVLAVAELTAYLRERLQASGKAAEPLSALFADALAATPTATLAIVLSERLVNMPAQIVTPMLRMMHEEAGALGPAFAFTHMILLSRVFVAGSADLDDAVPIEAAEPEAGGKKSKKKRRAQAAAAEAAAASVFAYHAEDEVVAQFASATVDFAFKSAPGRDHGDAEAGAFGVETRGRLSAVPWADLPKLVDELERHGAM